MALVGNLRDFGLSDFLYLVDRGYKTGRLVLRRPGDQAFLYFQNGKLLYATQSQGEERLGDLMLRAGKIGLDQLQYAQHLQQTTQQNKPLGLILVELGYINREGIIRTVRSQIEETVYRLFAWTEGDFRFEPDVGPPRETVTIPLSIENVIMEGVRRIDEWSRIHDRIPTLDVIVRFADQPTERAKGVNLTPDEWRVFARINGADNIATIVRMTSLSDFDVCRIIYGFIQAGLVEVVKPLAVAAAARGALGGGATAATTGGLAAPISSNGRSNGPHSGGSGAAPVPTAAPKRGLILRLIDRIRGM